MDQMFVDAFRMDFIRKIKKNMTIGYFKNKLISYSTFYLIYNNQTITEFIRLELYY